MAVKEAKPKTESTHTQQNPLLTELEDENRLLKDTVHQLRGELDRFRTPALLVAELSDLLERDGRKMAIIKVPNGNKFLVDVSAEAKKLSPGCSILVEQKNLTVIDYIQEGTKYNVEQFVIIDKPNIPWEMVGGLQEQIRDIQEVVELPLKRPELFKKVGITPPKGILLHGPPGTGKTLIAKAVATSTQSTFIEVVGSELVQKFIGEGAKLVKEIFDLARDHAPAIVFIDEIDSLAAKRVDMGTSGEREVQRTFMQLLAEIDGFNSLGNVKIIAATNRKDILDPAIIRPGRLDRLIEVPAPNKDGLREIFKIHTARMTMDKKINVERILKMMEGFSGAEVRAVCTEAGYFAIRDNRFSMKEQDFVSAVEKVKRSEELEGDEYLHMFG
jgi:proteasome regulatory subunit